MRPLLRVFVSLIWALWFGGIIGLFLSVTTLFHNDRPLAIQTAPQLFHAFEKYQLILAALALIGTFAWRVMFDSGQVVIIFALLGTATLGAVFETVKITPRIDAMRIAEETHTPAFSHAHGLSMIIYCGVAVLLLLAGIALLTTPSQRSVKGS